MAALASTARHDLAVSAQALRAWAVPVRGFPYDNSLEAYSWGLEALGSSDCVTGAVDAYLLNRTLPPAGTVCTGRVHPYEVTAR